MKYSIESYSTFPSPEGAVKVLKGTRRERRVDPYYMILCTTMTLRSIMIGWLLIAEGAQYFQ